ncbi:MAG TPA: hypothetical protein VF240_11270 [Pyrinomonadaceae bacterium]
MRLLIAAAVFACASASVSAQGARDLLTNFPDSQFVMYVNSQRIFNEALPRVVPQAKLDKMFADALREAKFDMRSIHFVAVGARFKEPMSLKTPPEFIFMLKGDFNADGLLSMARLALNESGTSENYKGRTLTIFKMKKVLPPPPPAGGTGSGTGSGAGSGAGSSTAPQASDLPFSELAAVSFDPNTLVVGIPAYVRAAVDAAGGDQQGRIRADLLDLVTRNPDNLLSFAGDIPSSLSDMMKSVGAPQNEEINRVVASLRQVQMAVQMTAEDFGVQSIVKTDTAENANGLNGLISMGLSFARMGIEGQLQKVPASKPQEREAMQAALDAITSVRNAATDNEVQVNISVPQAKIATFVEREMARRKAAPAKSPVKRRVRRGRRR